MTTNAATDVVYHGNHRGPSGPGTVTVETPAGEVLGLLNHVVRHSPTGLSWGYGGSGPADTARSILLAALGDSGRCPTCAGRGRVAFTADEEEPEPYDREKHGPDPKYHPGDEAVREDLVIDSCYDCDGDGHVHVPYMEFKFDVVAGWGDEWRITRAEVLAWLTAHGFEPKGGHR